MTVVGLGALCELDAESEHQLSFRVSEFAVLDDGRRVTLHEERGFSASSFTVADGSRRRLDPWTGITLEGLEADVRTVVLPDGDTAEDHPWEWLVELIERHGIDTSVDQLRAVPYEVHFGGQLLERMRHP